MVKHTQAIRRQQSMNCLSVFDYFVGLALKGLNTTDVIRSSTITMVEDWMQSRVRNTIKHLRWNFLRKSLTAERVDPQTKRFLTGFCIRFCDHIVEFYDWMKIFKFLKDTSATK